MPENKAIPPARPSDSSRNHEPDALWDFFRKTLLAAAVVVGIATVILLAEVLCVIFAGTLLAVVLYRVARLISRGTDLPHGLALLLLFVAAAVAAWGTGVAIGPRLADETRQLVEKLREAVDQVGAELEVRGLHHFVRDAPEIGRAMLKSPDAARLVGGVFSSATAFTASVLLILFIGIYGAYEPTKYFEGAIALFPPARRPLAREALLASLDTLWYYTLGRLISVGFIGCIVTISLWILNVPLPLALGVVAGLLSFVPMIGGFVAILPAALLAFQVGPMTAVYVIAIYAAAQAVDNHIVTPVVQSHVVSLPPILVLVSQVVSGLLFGVIGVVVATPLMAVLAVLLRRLYIEPLERSAAPLVIASH